MPQRNKHPRTKCYKVKIINIVSGATGPKRKWQPRLKWPSHVGLLQGHQKWHQLKANVWFPVINSNLCRISRTVSEIRRLIGRKSPIRTHPTLIQRPRSGWPPSNFGMNVISPETRMMGLPYGEKIMIVHECDRQTDGQNYYHKDRATQSVAR